MNKEIIAELDKILPVVARVHGENHPELQEVVELYKELKENPSKDVLEKLRNVTADYNVPEDACPTYEKTYHDLAQLDKELA